MLKDFLPKLDPEIEARIDAIPRHHVGEFGVDPFGFDPDKLKEFAPIAVWLYRHYFRCEVFGIDNIPSGRMVVIANHSGQLPFDGMMIETAFLLEAKQPRILRGMAERWSAELPFVSHLFARGGQVVGDPNTCRKLLEMDEAVIVFPEGVKGIVKLFHERYQLLKFGTGFMRLALQTKAPILPIAVIGAEEQAPSVANLAPLAKMLKLPALPLVLPQIIPLPLPVKYRIHIGEPLQFEGDGTEDDDVIFEYVQQSKANLQHLIQEGLRQRESIFF